MNTSTKPILNLITNSTTTNQFNLNTFGCSEQDQSFISFIHSFLTSSNINSSFKGSHHSISLPTQDSSELYYLLDRLLSLIQSLTNQLQTSTLAQDELLSHLKISQSNLILAESSVYDLEKVIDKLQQQQQQSQTSPTTNTNNQSKRRDRVDSETDVGIYGRLNLFRFGRRSTSTNIKPSSSSSPSLLSSPLNLSSSSSSSSSLMNCSSASSQSSFTSISSIHSSNLNKIEKLKYESLQLTQENQLLKSSLENIIESKRQIEGELESLSIELFEEANRMVRDERLKFVELENQLNELKNQLSKPNDKDEFNLGKRFKDYVDLKEVDHTDAFCTVSPKNVKSSMISTPERNPNEIKLDSFEVNSPETMNFINPRLSKRFSQLIKPINNRSISNSICEVQQTYSPEPTDLDLNEWYKDLDKDKSNTHLDVEEEEESEGMKRKQTGKERFKRSNSRISYTSTSSKDIIDHHSINCEKRFSSSSISLKRSSIITSSSSTEEKKSRLNSNLNLKPLLLNMNKPIHSRLKIDSNLLLKRHSSLGYHFHPKISSPLSNQINKRSSSFNLISSSTSNTSNNDLSIGDSNMIKDEIKSQDEIKIQRKNDTGNHQSKENGLNDHHDLHLDLDSLLASIVDCAESLGFQDELRGIFH